MLRHVAKLSHGEYSALEVLRSSRRGEESVREITVDGQEAGHDELKGGDGREVKDGSDGGAREVDINHGGGIGEGTGVLRGVDDGIL